MTSDLGKSFPQQELLHSSRLNTFRRPKMSSALRRRMGRNCADPVKIAGYPLKLRGEFVSYHNLYHFEISQLERILIGKAMVSGIHGFYSHMFHDSPIEGEYEGVLDEARLAVHEWMTRPSFYNTLKLINWIFWFISRGINPFAVIFRHARSLWRFRQTANQTFVAGCFELRQCREPVQLPMVGKSLKRVK